MSGEQDPIVRAKRLFESLTAITIQARKMPTPGLAAEVSMLQLQLIAMKKEVERLVRELEKEVLGYQEIEEDVLRRIKKVENSMRTGIVSAGALSKQLEGLRAESERVRVEARRVDYRLQDARQVLKRINHLASIRR